ncbi:MAG TPA: phosphatase PAP2 family protein [Candidatus Limnocylindria bacterium]|nr:phosphatase PAP2 family protein [Candidatus Limnocylindria bacterium]
MGLPLLGLITLSYLVIGRQTTALDSALLQSARGTGGPFVELFSGLTHAGDTAIIAALTAALAIVLAAKSRARTSLLVISGVSSAALANSVLKVLVARARPDPLLALIGEDGAGYPSGHAALSATLYGVVAVLIACTGLPRPLRIGVVGAMTILVLLVGASRVYLGVHYPSDVVAGWLLGTIVVATFRWLGPRVDRRWT